MMLETETSTPGDEWGRGLTEGAASDLGGCKRLRLRGWREPGIPLKLITASQETWAGTESLPK